MVAMHFGYRTPDDDGERPEEAANHHELAEPERVRARPSTVERSIGV
jgi:hypothetical protein